jgi:hypothetical protein
VKMTVGRWVWADNGIFGGRGGGGGGYGGNSATQPNYLNIW